MKEINTAIYCCHCIWHFVLSSLVLFSLHSVLSLTAPPSHHALIKHLSLSLSLSLSVWIMVLLFIIRWGSAHPPTQLSKYNPSFKILFKRDTKNDILKTFKLWKPYIFHKNGPFDYILLKTKVLYWHWWFHEEHLTSMETFHSTNASYSGKIVGFLRLLKYFT